jgi:hypothetical protein
LYGKEKLYRYSYKTNGGQAMPKNMIIRQTKIIKKNQFDKMNLECLNHFEETRAQFIEQLR